MDLMFYFHKKPHQNNTEHIVRNTWFVSSMLDKDLFHNYDRTIIKYLRWQVETYLCSNMSNPKWRIALKSCNYSILQHVMRNNQLTWNNMMRFERHNCLLEQSSSASQSRCILGCVVKQTVLIYWLSGPT